MATLSKGSLNQYRSVMYKLFSRVFNRIRQIWKLCWIFEQKREIYYKFLIDKFWSVVWSVVISFWNDKRWITVVISFSSSRRWRLCKRTRSVVWRISCLHLCQSADQGFYIATHRGIFSFHVSIFMKIEW